MLLGDRQVLHQALEPVVAQRVEPDRTEIAPGVERKLLLPSLWLLLRKTNDVVETLSGSLGSAPGCLSQAGCPA